jgi:hypothetical protein
MQMKNGQENGSRTDGESREKIEKNATKVRLTRRLTKRSRKDGKNSNYEVITRRDQSVTFRNGRYTDGQRITKEGQEQFSWKQS